MKKIISVSWMILVVSTALFSQNFKEDYKRVQESYSRLEKFYCEVKVSQYDTGKPGKAEEVMTTKLKKNGNQFMYLTGQTIMLVNERCVLNVDKQQKRLTYSVVQKQKNKQDYMASVTGMLDSLLKQTDSIVFAGMQNNKKNYIIYSSRSPIIRSEISIDERTALYDRLTYYYKPDKFNSLDKVTIVYENMNTSPVFEADEFSEKKYAIYNGKALTPVTAYSGYKATIIDSEKN